MDIFSEIVSNLNSNTSFVVEAGAGSGKTYLLIQTLQYLITNKRNSLIKNRQKIICITYTNVAKNEIIHRIENNELIKVLTIHEFLWNLVGSFNKQLVAKLSELNEELRVEKPENFNVDLASRINQVIYDEFSFRNFEEGKIDHDDVITLSKMMIQAYPNLSRIIVQKYPYIFIDEYQDTAPETIEALIDFIKERFPKKILLGFYGDSYQKIYDSGVGSLQIYIDANKIQLINKKENYRSSKTIRILLNNFRTNITQEKPIDKEEINGSAKFINCMNYPERGILKVREYENLIIPIKELNYNLVISELEQIGWNFSANGNDKILIIANSKVAQKAGFGKTYKIYSQRYYDAKEELIKRKNSFIRLFLGSIDNKTSIERRTGIEHLISDWKDKDIRSVIKYLNKVKAGSGALKKHRDKKKIKDILIGLIEVRKSGTIKEVFEYCKNNDLIRIRPTLEYTLSSLSKSPSEENGDERKRLEKNIIFYNDLFETPYEEIIYLFKYIQDQTAFSTKHGTKGEEYRNVLVVIDDTSWKSKYNFSKFISNSDSKKDRLIRTRNLFYVSCSRAIENLVVLSLSEMENETMTIIKDWFGESNVTTK